MQGLYLIPDRQNLEESITLGKQYQGMFEYNDFFLGAIFMFAIWCIVEAIIMRSRKKHSLKESAEEEIQE